MNYGAKADGVTDDNAAFVMAEAEASRTGKPLYIPAGKYFLSIRLQHDGIQLIGDKVQGRFFDDQGTILLGIINCNGKKNIAVSNIGIDSRNLVFTNTYNDAALTSGDAPQKGSLSQTFDNIALLGNGYADYKHGILCQAGPGISMHNIYVKDFFHGIAIRSSNVSIDGVTADFCGFTSIVVKSADAGNELVENVVVRNVRINGSKDDLYKRGGAVLIISYNNNSVTQNVTVDSVYSSWGGVGAVNIQQDSGILRNVWISNCHAENCGDNDSRAAFDITGGSNLNLSNCRTVNCAGIGFRSSGNPVQLAVRSSYESGSVVKPWVGSYQYLQLNGVEIIK